MTRNKKPITALNNCVGFIERQTDALKAYEDLCRFGLTKMKELLHFGLFKPDHLLNFQQAIRSFEEQAEDIRQRQEKTNYEGLILGYKYIINSVADEEGGGVLIEFPDLEGCLSYGETIKEVKQTGAEAVRNWIKLAKIRKDKIPKPIGTP